MDNRFNRFEFQRLFPDLQWEVIVKMSDQELVNLCRSSNAMENFCNTRDWFWRDRIQSQFGLDSSDSTIQQMLIDNGNNWFRVYFVLIKLNKLKQKLSPHLNKYSLTDLYNLQRLDLHNNQLSEIPTEISNLINLQVLYLASNQLTEIPREIGNLTNLRRLYLYGNQLSEIPTEIGNLTNLQNLALDDNQLTELPREIGNLTYLQYLTLYENQLTDPTSIKQWLPNVRIFW